MTLAASGSYENKRVWDADSGGDIIVADVASVVSGLIVTILTADTNCGQ